jgi:ABC-type multidrug transport system fused ATPase/permease subunit
MRRFFGVLAIFLGVVFLGESLNLWRWEIFLLLLKFWPLLLILIGLFLLIADWLWSLVIILFLIILLAVLSTFKKELFQNLLKKNDSYWQYQQKQSSEIPKEFFFYLPR